MQTVRLIVDSKDLNAPVSRLAAVIDLGPAEVGSPEEVAGIADMKPEALMKRIQRLRGRVPGGRT